MVIVNYKIQDGENIYREWDYFTSFSEDDYNKGKVKDFELLQTMYCVEEDDLDDNNTYWSNERLVSIEGVRDIDQPTLDILRRYV